MSDIVIKVKNLTKVYWLYDKPIDRLKESIHPFKKKYHKDFYALNDISFDVKKGEIIGIIGKNGSGKSTLLKIITGVLNPTSGSIEVTGKVSALLELGAGFNPEYTGIENIYLNGMMMGYTREDMDKKISSIIEFADIGDFVYQPVKMYSSGMFSRLAFAVAINVEPDILIVDEALSVGDAAFAFKCINYMKKIVERGTTILMVTHDIQTVRSFCNSVLWIDKGILLREGSTLDITSEYVRFLFEDEKDRNDYENNERQKNIELTEYEKKEKIDYETDTTEKKDENINSWGNGDIKIIKFSILDEDGKDLNVLEWGQQVTVTFTAKALKDINCENVGFGFSFRNRYGLDIIVSTTIEEGLRFGNFKSGDEMQIRFEFENILAPGEYLLTLQVEDRTNKIPEYYEFIENAKVFKVIANKIFSSLVLPKVKQDILIKGVTKIEQ